MIDSRKDFRTAGKLAEGGTVWTRPSIKRIAAGSAEQGGSTTTDLNLNQS